MSHSKKAVGGVLLLAAVIGACGGDDEAPATASPIATVTSTAERQTSTPSPTPTPTPTEEPTTTATQSGQNQPPTASFTAEPSCTTSNSSEITFTSTSTDPDGDELSHSWDIQSGTPNTATGQVVTGVTFPNVAPYPVTLSVDDGRGGTDSATTAIGPC